MRLLTIVLLAVLLFPVALWAETSDERALFEINDVVADVTATNAAAARDQAIMQAQRNALEQLLARLGADAEVASKQSDDQLASLVQGFEVQQERTSAVRYIGTFTVQFKPQAVRALLAGSGDAVTVSRGKPVVILPVVLAADRVILWEDNTAWRKAWEEAASRGGLIPLIVPTPDMDVIAMINGKEAMAGKAEAIKAIMAKYQTASLAVVTYQEPTKPNEPAALNLMRYDAAAAPALPVALSLGAGNTALNEGVKLIRQELEKDWRDANKPPSGTTTSLAVAVPIRDLAVWAEIRQRLTTVKPIKRTNIIALSRGQANIELEYFGDLPTLLSALQQQNLILQQANTGGWQLEYQ